MSEFKKSEELFERSKNDREVIVGSEIRAAIQELRNGIEPKDKLIAEARAEIKKLHSILFTIRAADFDVEELRGHQCYAKQWACALRDRLKRIEAEK